MKQCSKRKEWKARDQFSRFYKAKDKLQSRCRVCNSRSSAEWASINRDSTNLAKRRWLESNLLKKRIYNVLRSAVTKGLVIKATACQMCGREDVRLQGHHDDYSKPLEVRWLCGSCHRAYHKAMDRGETHEAVRID